VTRPKGSSIFSLETVAVNKVILTSTLRFYITEGGKMNFLFVAFRNTDKRTQWYYSADGLTWKEDDCSEHSGTSGNLDIAVHTSIPGYVAIIERWFFLLYS